MSDYIKRADAIDAMERVSDGICEQQTIDALCELPSADVVEVVRCRDCKHHEELLNNHDGKVLCWVHGIDVVVDRNGYCNYGEREEQENE